MWKNRQDARIEEESFGALLKCPECSGVYLHQGNTTIYERREDEEWTTVIAQDGSDVNATKFPSEDTHNPSARRHGLIIEFRCEFCGWGDGPIHHLAIYQHKGNTFLEWVS